MSVTDYDETVYTKMYKGSGNEIKVRNVYRRCLCFFFIKPRLVKKKSMDFVYLLIVVWSIY